MIEFEIKTPKQENGLWGTPLQLTHMHNMRRLSDEDNLKFSALCIGIAEKFQTETFQIYFLSDKGFLVKLSESGYFNIPFKHYKIEGNKIVWVWMS